jgi:hypothetical protein
MAPTSAGELGGEEADDGVINRSNRLLSTSAGNLGGEDEGWIKVMDRRHRLAAGSVRNLADPCFSQSKIRDTRLPSNRSGPTTVRSRISIVKNNNSNKVNVFTVNSKASPKSWCDLVKEKKQSETLKFFDPAIVNDRKTAIIGEEELLSAEKMWSNSILIYLVGKRPYYMFFKAYIRRTWLPKGKFEVFARDNGFYLVQFELEEDCNKILDGGPWLMDGKFIIMKKWNSTIKYEKDLLLSIPIWVRFPNLNFAYWNHISLCKIASIIGRPIAMDEHTKNRSRISFARMLIEVDASFKFESEVQIQLPRGDFVMQNVEYEFIPPVCHNCVCFGHTDKECPISFKQQWKPKTTASNNDTNSMEIITEENSNQQNLNSKGAEHNNTEVITIDDANVQIHTTINKALSNQNTDNLIKGNDISPSDMNAVNTEPDQRSIKEPAITIAASPSTNTEECVVSNLPSHISMAAAIAKGSFNQLPDMPHIQNIEDGPPMSTGTLDPNLSTSSTKVSVALSSSEKNCNRELLNHNNPAIIILNSQASNLTTEVLNSFQVLKDMKDSNVDESSLSQSCIKPTYPTTDELPNNMPKNLTSINPEYEKAIADIKGKNIQEKKKNKLFQDSVTPTIRTRSQANPSK